MEIERNNVNNQTNILDLNDYELLEILKYLNATDLWQLNKTCLRFNYLVRTRKLWRRVELRDAPRVEEKIKFAFNHTGEITEDVRLCAEERFMEILPQHFEMYLKPTNLTILALENQKINGENVKLRDFPDSLLELSLKKSFILNGRLFFERSNEKMVNLKVIVLDHCFWLESIMLVHMSKYESLEYLSLYKCKRMSDSDMAYISLAGRFGFNKLRILDCRFSGLGDQVLRVLYTKPNLREIYFQNYLTTYYLEKSQRELEISNGSLIKKYSHLNQYDDIPMFDKETIQFYYGNINYSKKVCFNTVSDDGTLVYRFTERFKDDLNENGTFYKSVLYEKPYSDCECFKNDKNLTNLIKNKGPTNKMKSLKKREMAKVEEQINNELELATSNENLTRTSHLLTLPPTLGNKNTPNTPKNHVHKDINDLVNLEATIENHFTDWIHRRDPRNSYEMAMFENADLNPPIHNCEEFVFFLADNHRNFQQNDGPSGQNDQNQEENDQNQEENDQNQEENDQNRTRNYQNQQENDQNHSRNCQNQENDQNHSRNYQNQHHNHQNHNKMNENSLNFKRKRKNSDDGPSISAKRKEQQSQQQQDVGKPRELYVLVDAMVNRFGAPTKRQVGLKKVSLRGFKRVTDKTLESLAHLDLQLIDVTFTKVTEEGLKDFVLLNPDCRVIHETLCRCKPRMHF